jgi:CheY-like chemotaxis protein
MRKRFILVADTGDAFLSFVDTLRKELETSEYTLLHAKNGQEAIDYLDLMKSDIDLAIIATELPVVSGLDVIWRLVRQEQPKPPKIIATSAVDVPLLKQVLEEFGVGAVVRIPIPVQGWRKIIEAVLSKELSGSSQVTVTIDENTPN